MLSGSVKEEMFTIITVEPPIGTSHVDVFISGTSLMVRPWSQTAQIQVRPDCKEDTILSLLEQVLFSLGGRMGKRYPEDIVAASLPPGNVVYCPMLMVASSNENLIWNEITVVLGANKDFQRIVFVNIGSSKSLSYTVKQIGELNAFARELVGHLYTALNSSGIVDYSAIDMTPITNCVPDGIIDLGYIRDLQGSISQNMNERLQDEVNKIDEAMKAYELKCARLMTLLKPTYIRASIGLPSVPEKVSLSSYSLVLKRALSIRDINAEQSRLLLLRARRNYKEFIQNRKLSTIEKRFDMIQLGSHSFSYEDYDKYGCQVSFILNDLQQQLVQWSAEEYGIRIQRKVSSVKDRFEALRRFKIQLLLTLHDRFQSTPSSSNVGLLQSWGFSTISNDKKFQLSVQERFPFADDAQPLLVDAIGQIDGKKGNVYLTLSHLFSYSASLIMGGIPTMTVIPVSSMKTLELYVGGKLLSSVTFPLPSKEPASPSKIRCITKGPTDDSIGGVEINALTGAYSIRIIDFAEASHEVMFMESTADFAVRIFDVLDFVIKEKLYSVTEYQPNQRRQFLKSEEEKLAAETSLEDLEDMLEITFEKGVSDNAMDSASSVVHNISAVEEESAPVSVSDTRQEVIKNDEALLDMDFSSFSKPSSSSVPSSSFDIFAPMAADESQPANLGNNLALTHQTIAGNEYLSKDNDSTSFNQLPPQVIPAEPSVLPALPPLPATAPNKRLASNIQKFLQQSQQKKD